MSAREKISLNPSVSRLGIIAGSGVLPARLVEACEEQGIDYKIIGLGKETDCVTPDLHSRIGSSGKTLRYLREQGIHDVVLIGAVKRPNLFNVWPDWFSFKFFFRVLFKSMGDSSLLDAARQLLEGEGLIIHGVHEFLPELLLQEGVIGAHAPPDKYQLDIQLGLKESQELGRHDIGQAVIVKDGQVIGREDKRGTSALIKAHGTAGAILVKTCKPQQDRNLDLPTIGPETARLCAERKMAGIVGQAGETLLVEREKTARIADANGLFLMGVTI
jgi:hypothetical protein